MDAQQRLLDDVLGLGGAAEHPVGDREGRRPQLRELVFFSGHDEWMGPFIIRFTIGRTTHTTGRAPGL
jgi:hypothetical protein